MKALKHRLHYDSDGVTVLSSTVMIVSLMRVAVYIGLHYLSKSTTYLDNFHRGRSH